MLEFDAQCCFEPNVFGLLAEGSFVALLRHLFTEVNINKRHQTTKKEPIHVLRLASIGRQQEADFGSFHWHFAGSAKSTQVLYKRKLTPSTCGK